MDVTVRFLDGEELEGTADSVSLDGGGFTLVGTGGNTHSIWVGPGAIKYVLIQPHRRKPLADADPRGAGGESLPKLVLHFLDGEVVRTYRDRFFAPQPGGFAVRLWDARSRQLVKAIVAGASLKGIFTVEEWDSRPDGKKRTRPRRRPSEDFPPVEGGPEAQTGTAQPAPIEPADAAAAEDVEEKAILVLAEQPVDAPAAVPPGGPVEAEAPLEAPAPLIAEPVDNVRVVVTGDTEERRPTFHSGLGRRAKLLQTPSPEEERHIELISRISEVLGSIGPIRVDPDDGESPD